MTETTMLLGNIINHYHCVTTSIQRRWWNAQSFVLLKYSMAKRFDGSSRTVILTKKLAYKFPSFYSWKHFLWGLLANMQEREFSKIKEMQSKLCPVLFSVPGGFLVVMPKVRVLRDGEMTREQLNDFCTCNENYTIPAEPKPDSFGYHNGNLVAIDYG